MKRYFLLLVACCALLSNCSKHQLQQLPLTGHAFTDSAFAYLNSHLSRSELNQLSTRDYTLMTKQNSHSLLLMHYKDGKRFILVEKTMDEFSGHVIQFNFSGDNKNSGSLLTEDLITKTGHLIHFSSGKVSSIHPTNNGQINSYAINHSVIHSTFAIVPMKSEDVVVIYVSTGGGGSHGVSLSSLYYMTDFNSQYYYSYVSSPLTSPAGFGSGGGGGVSVSVSSPTTAPVVDIPMIPGAVKPINIAQELACFGVVAGATYSLRINVNQPNPGTRDIINTTATRPVGHTYITLEQKNPNGTIISRNVGFYPQDFIKPADGLQPGTYQDDTKTPFSVSMTISVTPAEFMNAKNYLAGVKQYALQTANCTTVGITAFEKAGVRLPKTIGVLETPKNNYTPLSQDRFPLFKGVNPGDLGEDIRGMNATVFSQNNGGRNVRIDKSNTNSQSSSRTGQCN